MSFIDYSFAAFLSALIMYDLYSFIFRDRIEKEIYRRTVEDVNWNRKA